MEEKIWRCEVCKKEAKTEKQKRKDNWLQLHGGSLKGISVWLEKPRKGNSFMHTVGFRDREYDFCSIKCLVKALEARESI